MNVVEYFRLFVVPTLNYDELRSQLYWFALISFLEVEDQWEDTSYPYKNADGDYKKWSILMSKEGFGLEDTQVRVRLGSDWARSKLRDYPNLIALSSHPKGDLGQQKLQYFRLLAAASLHR
tara:strand:- start:55 stop:417 length:363 start_codon:yes stop_codon:yes gene_type:complete